MARLRFNETELVFGASNNIGERRYLMVDQRIYLLPDIHLAFIAQGLPGLIERQLLPAPYQIQSIRLPGYHIARAGDGNWRSDPAIDLDAAGLRQLVENWQKLPASRIAVFNLQGSARDVIEVRLQDGRSLDFLLMATEPELVLANPAIDLQFHFLRDYADQLIAPRGSTDAN